MRKIKRYAVGLMLAVGFMLVLSECESFPCSVLVRVSGVTLLAAAVPLTRKIS